VPKNVALPNAEGAAAQLIILDKIGSSNACNALLQRYYLARFARKTEEDLRGSRAPLVSLAYSPTP
jgi:hypothetical protein